MLYGFIYNVRLSIWHHKYSGTLFFSPNFISFPNNNSHTGRSQTQLSYNNRNKGYFFNPDTKMASKQIVFAILFEL